MNMELNGISKKIDHDDFLKDLMIVVKKYNLWGEIVWNENKAELI